MKSDTIMSLFNAVAEAQLSPDVANSSSDFEDMSSSIFANIDSRIPENYDWSTYYNEELETALQQYSKQYYIQQNHNVIDEVEGALILFNYDIHKSENCKGAAQTFLIYKHLY